MNLNIFNSSGGVSYHIRAMWNAKRWQPFCRFVDAWLQEWFKLANLDSRSTLVLIGPNAGYTLPHWFVQSFSHTIVVEPDPLAYALFQTRFQTKCSWVSQDFFSLSTKKPDAKKLSELFVSYPGAVFLFCNIIGQIPIYLRNKKNFDVDSYMKDLGEVIVLASKNSPVASYHDRYSSNRRKPNEVIDHLTGGIFTGLENVKEFPWQISRMESHQIEFVRSK